MHRGTGDAKITRFLVLTGADVDGCRTRPVGCWVHSAIMMHHSYYAMRVRYHDSYILTLLENVALVWL
jgi:hypothetical protein